jgi:DNA-binding SARP family transcriptional activator
MNREAPREAADQPEANRRRLKKAARLVKLLALAPYYKRHRERVTDLLWPEPEAEAAIHNLHRTVTILVSVTSSMARVPAAEGASMASWLENEIVSTSYSKTVWRR